MANFRTHRIDLSAFFILVRPGNVALTALSVFVGGIISNPHWPELLSRLVIAAISAALIAGGGNAYNDYCDRDLDRLQKTRRPLPSGRLAPAAALWLANACFLGGILVAYQLGPIGFSIAAWAGLLLILYSRFLKRLPLVGNLAVALISALTFIYGGVAVFTLEPAFWAAALAFFFHLGREIIKDMEDEIGDRAAGAATWPVRYGLSSARWGALAAFVFLIMLLPLPYLWGHFRPEYLIVVLCGVAPILIVVSVLSLRWSKPEQFHRLNLILKWDMLMGLFALYLGRPLV
jgi:geranylgeranylglycerol-phosphate geranylgeranyltransferase